MREVIDKSRPIADVARENGLVAQTLGNWVNIWRAEHVDEEPPLYRRIEIQAGSLLGGTLGA